MEPAQLTFLDGLTQWAPVQEQMHAGRHRKDLVSAGSKGNSLCDSAKGVQLVGMPAQQKPRPQGPDAGDCYTHCITLIAHRFEFTNLVGSILAAVLLFCLLLLWCQCLPVTAQPCSSNVVLT
jgi:hypothetical protein